MGTARLCFHIPIALIGFAASVAIAQEPPPAATAKAVKIAPAKVLIDGPSFDRSATVAALSPDGKQVLTLESTVRGIVALRDAATGTVLQTITDKMTIAPVNAVFLDKDRVAVCWGRSNRSNERKPQLDVIVYASKDGAVLHTLTVDTEINEQRVAMSASVDGKWLVTHGNRCEVWDTGKGERIARIEKPFETPPKRMGERSARITDDNKRLLLGDGAGTWRIFELSTGAPIGPARSSEATQSVSFSPDGKIASVAGISTLSFYNAETGEPIDLKMAAPPPLVSATGKEYALEYSETAFSPDGKWWAGQKSNVVYLYDLTPTPPTLTHRLRMDNSQRRRLTWSADSKRLIAVGGDNNYVADWNITTGRPTVDGLEHDYSINTLTFSPAGDELLTADVRGKLVRWSLPDLKPIRSRPETALEFGFHVVQRAWYLPDNKTLLTEGENGHFKWLKRETFERQHEFMPTRNMTLDAYAFTPDAGLFATHSTFTKPKLQFFKDRSSDSIGGLDPSVAVRDMLFTPDGARFLYTDRDSISILSAEDRTPIGSLKFAKQSGTTSVAQLMISPDGRWVVGTNVGTLVGWQLGKGDIESNWILRLPRVGTPTISPASTLIIVPWQGGVQLIELHTGQPIVTLEIPDAPPRLAALVPGSSLMLVVNGTRRMVTYDLKALLSATGDMQAAVQGATAKELWNRIDGDPAEAYASLLELERRNELMPRVREWLEASRDRIARTKLVNGLIAQLNDPQNAVREKAHRELERQGAAILSDLQTASAQATGETADRLASLVRLASESGAAPASRTDDSLRLTRLREMLSWSRDKDAIEISAILKP